MKKHWVDLSLFNLNIVALLGFTLRSKMLFALPFINFNGLSNAHAHFAFGGWVTLVLISLMTFNLLPASLHGGKVYQGLLWGIFITAWCALLNALLNETGAIPDIFSTLFIFITYVFCWLFIKHVRISPVSRTVKLLSISAVLCLVLSSGGIFMLVYLFQVHSLNAILYRDALFSYLHLQYNGFFTLAVFALLVDKIVPAISLQSKKNIHRFAVLLCISVLPSLFLSYLWQDPDSILRFCAIIGSITVLFALYWFIISAFSLRREYKNITPAIRYLGLIAMGAFALKMLLQSLTIFPVVGNAVFGDRPMIIAFLHLVFLVFVTLFIMAYISQEGLVDLHKRFAKIAVMVFSSGVVVNELVMMSQGLGTLFQMSSNLYPWLLWLTSIWMLAGTMLIAAERIKFNYRKTE